MVEPASALNSFGTEMARGILITFEGPCFAGKTYHSEIQYKRLLETLPLRADAKPAVILLRFPVKLEPRIVNILRRQNLQPPNPIGPAVNRQAHFLSQLAITTDSFAVIIKALNDGQHVIVDSYILTEIASIDFELEDFEGEISLDWCLATLKTKAPKPDLVIHLVAPLWELMSRAGFTVYTPLFDNEDRDKVQAYHDRICSNLRQIQQHDGFKNLPWLKFLTKQRESEEAVKMVSKLIDNKLTADAGDEGSIWMF